MKPKRRGKVNPKRKTAATNDAKILFESEMIKNDQARLMAARSAAIEIAMKDKEKSEVMKRIAKTKIRESKPRKKKKRTNDFNVFKRLK